MEYIERNCIIEHQGHKFEAGGAVVTPDYIVAYIGSRGDDGKRQLTDWHGKVIGTCRITSTWRTPRSFVSSTMSQVYAVVDGVTYTGRSAGEVMIFKGRKVRT